jgi:hypothetical protein
MEILNCPSCSQSPISNSIELAHGERHWSISCVCGMKVEKSSLPEAIRVWNGKRKQQTKKHVLFELSMPNNAAWNGKWSGEGKNYWIVKTLNRKAAEAILAKGYYRYDFGDGWAAGIDVKEITAAEKTKCTKKSIGFASYGWMVDSIIQHGDIVTSRS